MTTRAVGKIARKAKGVVDNVMHPPFLRVDIPAQQARPAPPLGPQLGKPDRSYTLDMTHPPSVYLLRLASGAKKGAADSGTEVCGRITLKHIYHIAELKKQDPRYFTWDLQKVCTSLIGKAHRLGIEILSKSAVDSGEVDHSPTGYAEFQKERAVYLDEKKREEEQKKQAKMMRLA